MDATAGSTLDKNAANYHALSPVSFLNRTAKVFPERTAVVYHGVRRSYRQFAERCERLCAFLGSQGLGADDVVSLMLPNIPEMLELHFAGISHGRVLHPISPRLDATAIRFQLEHAQSRLLIFDREYRAIIEEALAGMSAPPDLIEVIDAYAGYEQAPSKYLSYEQALANTEHPTPLVGPLDEWNAIALSYTSGTTGNPKGVVTHHRGAYLNAMANVVAWSMPHYPVYLWVLPMFHCDGWCFPWTVTLLAGTHVCLRKVDADRILALAETEAVSHFCAAPVILSMLASTAQATGKRFVHPVKILTAGAAPAPAVIESVEAINAHITQVYGLTETYSSTVISAWHSDWDALPAAKRSQLKARQGIQFAACEDMDVVDAQDRSVPWDNATLGEVVVRGNTVMKGYLNNLQATSEAFRNGWFQTGDLAVRDEAGYISIKDRNKDMINSGGEKISSLEIEEVLFEHPAVLEAAVIAAPHAKWGEVPWAFVTVRAGMQLTQEELIGFCRARLAKYKVPTRVVFGMLDRTATGKVQKFKLRAKAIELGAAESADV